jgi:hypothetical protein
MKWIPYMSYWSRGYQGAPNEYIKRLHWLAAYYLKLNYGEVHLVTDSVGAKELNDVEWSSIDLALDNLDPRLGDWFWAAGKLRAFQIAAEKGQSFFHADYDVFLPNGLPHCVEQSQLFAQSPEDVVLSLYELPRVLPMIPKTGIMTEYPVQCAANTGIFGGQNFEFIHRYATEILELASHPENEILNHRRIYNHYGGASMLFEQYGLACAAKKYGIEIDYIFNRWPTKEEAQEKQFIHLMSAKRFPHIRSKITALVDRLKSQSLQIYGNPVQSI